MHEYALTERIVRIANEAAEKQDAKSVSSVSIVVGETSGILVESVQLYFDLIAEGTKAEGARLLVSTIPPEMRCPECGRNFVRPRFSFACPTCGVLGNPTNVGKEFYVESVELEL